MSDAPTEPLRAPQDRLCTQTCADGERCANWARRGLATCYRHDPEHRCTAAITGGTTDKHRAGERCLNRAIDGGTVCEYHGGASGHVKAAAENRVAEEKARRIMATYATPVQTTPMKALYDEVCRAAGRVAWLGQRVQEIEAAATGVPAQPDEEFGNGEQIEAPLGADVSRHPLVWGVTRIKHGGEDHGVTQEAAPNIWLKLYNEERDRLIKVSTAAVRAGLDERMVKLAEGQGRMVAGVIRAVLGDLALTEEQYAKAMEVTPRHLRALSA